MWWTIASMFASALMKKMAADRQQAHRESYLAQERQRQAGLQQQADAQLAQVTPQFTPEAQNATTAAASAKREAQITPNEPPTDYSNAASTQPQEVKSEVARKMVDAIQRGKQSASALARLGGYGDTAASNDIAIGHSGQAINQIANNSKASQSILGTELEQAQKAGGTEQMLGELIGTAGMLNSMGAFGGASTATPLSSEPLKTFAGASKAGFKVPAGMTLRY